MALPQHLLSMLLDEHQQAPLVGPLLSIGRQEIMCSYDEMMFVFRTVGVTPLPLPPDTPLGPIPGCGLEGQTNDMAFFGHLGVSSTTLDCSNFERADIIHDMNYPVPDELKGRYGTILDSGSLEHIFDIRQALVNIGEMLAPGGRVIHLSPVNNYVNHGFWQFSPTMFYDYYEANGYTDMRGHLLIQPRDDQRQGEWTILSYDPVEHFGINNFYNSADTMLLMSFSATKGPAATTNKIPIQAWYRQAHTGTRQVDRQYVFESKPEGGHRIEIRHLTVSNKYIPNPEPELLVTP